MVLNAFISADRTCVEVWAQDDIVGYIVRGHDGFSFVSTDVSATVYPSRLRVTEALNDAAWHVNMTTLSATA